MQQIQGAVGEVVVIYYELLATQEMRYHRLSLRVNNMAVFTIFWMSLQIRSSKAEKRSSIRLIIAFEPILPCYLCNWWVSVGWYN
jgi:hypothetical protein